MSRAQQRTVPSLPPSVFAKKHERVNVRVGQEDRETVFNAAGVQMSYGKCAGCTRKMQAWRDAGSEAASSSKPEVPQGSYVCRQCCVYLCPMCFYTPVKEGGWNHKRGASEAALCVTCE